MSNPAESFHRLREIPAELLKKLAADKPSTAALTALRKLFPEETLFRLAADLPRARHKLRNKLLLAKTSFADIPRAEMATARPVALYRMGRLFQAGAAGKVPARIHDLGCGAGADLCAFLEIAQARGISPAAMADRIQAIDNDPFAAWCAETNAAQVCAGLPTDTVRCADAAGLATFTAVPAGDSGSFSARILFLDPTRRNLEKPGARAVNDWSQCEPPTAVWAPWIEQGARVAMKVAPAFDWRAFEPALLAPQAALPQIEAIEWHGEVHEITLWWNFASGVTASPGTNAETSAGTGIGEFAPGRRATILSGEAHLTGPHLHVDSLFVPALETERLRDELVFADEPPQLGDLFAIPAPAVLRMDLAPAVAKKFQAPAMLGQPHLFRIPAAHAAAAAQSLLIKTGRLVANLPAREQDLRRALNSDLKHRRWQPQVLGVKGVPGIEDRIRQLEQHTRLKSIDRSTQPGMALITRVHQSHRVLFLEPVE